LQKCKDRNGRTYWISSPEAFEQIKRIYPDSVELGKLANEASSQRVRLFD